MNELTTVADAININYDENGNPTVSGRELHRALEVTTPYRIWFPRMCEYGFSEGTDFTTVNKNVRRADGAIMPQMQAEHDLTIDMAKELCMIQRTQKGKECRQFFIRIEEQWNSPEAVMARALKMADVKLLEAKQCIRTLETTVTEQKQQIDEMKPKALFADAVATSKDTILIRDLAKILKQNGIDIGAMRLFAWLRENGYLIRQRGDSYNTPTQYSMNLGLFEVSETPIVHSDGRVHVGKTAKVTGKGQQYFVNKFLKMKKQEREQE